jgi:hypothetical protein
MKQSCARPGSILVFVLVTLSALLLLCASTWRIAHRASLYARERMFFFERFYAVRTALDYAVHYCKEQKIALSKKSFVDKQVAIDPWSGSRPYTMQLSITAQGGTAVFLEAILYDSITKVSLMRGTCYVSIISLDPVQLAVTRWSIGK